MNYDFIKRAMSLTDEEKERIKSLHKRIEFLVQEIDRMLAKIPSEKTIEKARQYVLLIEELEFALQFWWGIPRDANYHSHWLRPKHCRCPKLDNTDIAYFGRGKIIVEDCPLHSVEQQKN